MARRVTATTQHANGGTTGEVRSHVSTKKSPVYENRIDHGLDWALIRAFCWHAVATMLRTVLRTHAISTTPEAQQARERIAKLFRDRPSIDYLTGNDSLWEPLERLEQELEMRHSSNVLPVQSQQPWQGEGGLGLEEWMDEGVWESF